MIFRTTHKQDMPDDLECVRSRQAPAVYWRVWLRGPGSRSQAPSWNPPPHSTWNLREWERQGSFPFLAPNLCDGASRRTSHLLCSHECAGAFWTSCLPACWASCPVGPTGAADLCRRSRSSRCRPVSLWRRRRPRGLPGQLGSGSPSPPPGKAAERKWFCMSVWGNKGEPRGMDTLVFLRTTFSWTSNTLFTLNK